MKRTLWITLLAVGISQTGCGGKTNDTAGAPELGAPSASAAKTVPTQSVLPSSIASGVPNASLANSEQPTAGPLDAMLPLSSLNLANPVKPEEIVGAFLDGMRTGNAAVIESLLSSRARKEIADKGLDIAPIGSPQAKFEIGAAQLADPSDPNTMLVTRNWIEPGTNGQLAGEYEVVWALVKEPTGWRICEMAVDTHQEGEEIQVVNFENLADVAPTGGATTNPPAQPEIPRTASVPGTAGMASPPSTVPPALPSSNPGGFPSSLPSSIQPGGLPPAANLPTSPQGQPGPAGASLPPVPAGVGGVSGGQGGLPPLPPAGFGNGPNGPAGRR
jgi:hypothetical protein